jgi:hypothetical protein
MLSKVSAHLKSTDCFTEAIKDFQVNPGEHFGSLDVENLYGSIPLSGENNCFEVVGSYFERYRGDLIFADVSKEDFILLLQLALNSDLINIGGELFKQNTGIAMGNNLSPIVAIIFMDFIESQVRERIPISLWVRYIDDIFYVTQCSQEQLLEVANSIHPSIKFTCENPKENRLPFLDTEVYLLSSGQFEYRLFVKPIHSGHVVPSRSHIPQHQKFSVMVNEFRRADRCSSNRENRVYSMNIIRDRFLSNGYPLQQVDKALRQALQPRQIGPKPKNIYVRMPFVDDRSASELRDYARETGLPVKIAFSAPKPLSQQLRKGYPPPCPRGCICDGRGQCSAKNVVYRIQCTLCQAEYVGETHRTCKRRRMEHCTQRESHVYKHFSLHHPSLPIQNNITFDIVARGFQDTMHRLAAEKTVIKDLKPSLNVQLH